MLSKYVYKNFGLIHAEVREAFRFPGVVKQSTHVFRRGGQKPYYVDFDELIHDPYIAEQIVQLFSVKIMEISNQRQIDLLGFINKYSKGTIGALSIAGAISIFTRIPRINIRLNKNAVSERVKAHPEVGKSKREALGGAKVLVVTDHVTGGNELLNAIDSVEYIGGTVTDAMAFTTWINEINLKEFDDRGVNFTSLYILPRDIEDLGLLTRNKK